MVLPIPAKQEFRPISLLTVVLFAGVVVLPLGCSKAAPPDNPPPAVVKWQGASENALEEWTELVGTTVPLPNHGYYRVSARVEGTVKTVFPASFWVWPAAEGEKVGAGTVFVQLDTTTIKHSLAEAEATQQSLMADKNQAQFASDQAEKEDKRLNGLKGAAGTGGPLISEADLEKARTALKDAQSKLDGANARLNAGARKLDSLREQLGYHTITSPISGRLGRMQVVPGQYLTIGTPIADVLDIDEQIDVLCFVPASMAGRLKIGQQAHTGAIDDEEGEAQGEVVYVANQGESETGNFAVKVRFDNKEKHLRANRLLRISILTKPGHSCLSVPEAAVQEDTETPTVVVALEIQKRTNDKGEEETVAVARRVQVALGVRDRKLHQVEILRLMDPEKEGEKKPVATVEATQFVVEGGQGVQTGDILKLDAGDD